MTQENIPVKTVTVHTSLLINNLDRTGEGELLRVVSPVTEELVAEFPGASLAQVDEAVTSAQAAFESGVWKDAAFRKTVLLRFADLIEAHRDQLMDVLMDEIGSPVNLKANHTDTPAAFVRWFAEAGTRDRTRHLGFNATNTAVSMVAYRPVGVVAAISAFNYPLLIGVTKIGAALAAGCTTVLLS
jgi:aldehyde dehydrogenase (NAD+)